MGIAIALAQYLVDRDVAYDLVSHPRTETASASAAASQVPADRLATSWRKISLPWPEFRIA